MNERNNCAQDKCILDTTGSCLGCNVLNIILEKRRRMANGEERPLVQRVKDSLCPQGNIPLVPSRTARIIVW